MPNLGSPTDSLWHCVEAWSYSNTAGGQVGFSPSWGGPTESLYAEFSKDGDEDDDMDDQAFNFAPPGASADLLVLDLVAEDLVHARPPCPQERPSLPEIKVQERPAQQVQKTVQQPALQLHYPEQPHGRGVTMTPRMR